MEQALYHPVHGYYSSGRAEIGRRGDYFTNVSVGPLFGKLLAAQFVEMWERLGKIDNFVIVEQGAHHGDLARDVLIALRGSELFSILRYVIVEPFPILQDRQSQTLAEFADKISWRKSLEDLEPFSGVHFSNELLDSMPVHLITRRTGEDEWREKFVTAPHGRFEFIDGPLSSAALREHVKKIPAIESGDYETEINLAALDWIESVSRKLQRGFVLVVDYGFARDEFYAPERSAGTLSCFAEHKRVSSPLEAPGKIDITAHVDWTSLAERAQNCGLDIVGFTDQHHFMTGIIAELLREEFSSDVDPKTKRALQTLLHPELLGRTFQFLVLAKDVDLTQPLSGLRFVRDRKIALGL